MSVADAGPADKGPITIGDVIAALDPDPDEVSWLVAQTLHAALGGSCRLSLKCIEDLLTTYRSESVRWPT
jgi:hypothetical protein